MLGVGALLTSISFVKLVPRSSEYGPEAWRRFGTLTEVGGRENLLLTAQGRKLVANIDQREGNVLHLRLIDPTDPNAADDPLACINADLVREGGFPQTGCHEAKNSVGFATVDKSLRYISSYPQVLKKLEGGMSNLNDAVCILMLVTATEGAKNDRLGIFE